MSQSDLDQLRIVLRSGEEPFRGDGASLRLIDYWRWSGSSLMDNTARGMLAEFSSRWPSVARKSHASSGNDSTCALHRASRSRSRAPPLSSRGSRPLRVRSSLRSAATGWDPKTGQYIEKARRWRISTCFVSWRAPDPLDVDKWQFFVLPSAVLDDACRQQQTIRLGPLKQLSPRACTYRDLKAPSKT